MKMGSSQYKESVSTDEIRLLPLTSFSGKILVVDDPGSVKEAVDLLSQYSVLGFDTETKPAFKKGVFNSVALLQLSVREMAVIFRLNKTGVTTELAALLTNKRIVKVGAAIRDDIKSLQKLRKFIPGGFIELQNMVGDYGIKDTGLRKMAAIILGIHISKSQQISNWERSSLTDQQLIYAATDAWVSFEIFKKLTEN